MSLEGLLQLVKMGWVVVLGTYFLSLGSGWLGSQLSIRPWKELEIQRLELVDSMLNSGTILDYFDGKFLMVKKQSHHVIKPK